MYVMQLLILTTILIPEAKKSFSVTNTKTEKTLLKVRNDYGIMTYMDNCEVAKSADILILAVKPQMIDGVLDEIRDSLKEDVLVVVNYLVNSKVARKGRKRSEDKNRKNHSKWPKT